MTIEEFSYVGSEPRHVMSESDMDKAINQMAKKIYQAAGESNDLVFIGIRTRGVPMAEWLARKYEDISGGKVPVGILDINLYRDDLSEVDHQPIVKQTELPASIQGKGIILVDDVLFTGRTIRAALDALNDFGRPRFVQLAVMVDRGFRELPIQAEYVAKRLVTTLQENVKVKFEATDGVNEIVIEQQL